MGRSYGKPEVSSAAIRLEGVALGVPVTPGGPTFTYIFEAAAEGQVQIKVPIINSANPDWTKQHTFAATIHVGPASGNPRKPHAFLMPDQSNTEPWKSAWTNLNNAQQSFKPSLPRLTGRSGTRGREPWPRQWRGHDGVDEFRGRKLGGCIENRDGRRLQPRSLPFSQGWCTSFASARL